MDCHVTCALSEEYCGGLETVPRPQCGKRRRDRGIAADHAEINSGLRGVAEEHQPEFTNHDFVTVVQHRVIHATYVPLRLPASMTSNVPFVRRKTA